MAYLDDYWNAYESERVRMDKRRNCSTGYSCGSTCIPVKKECLKESGSAIGKERLNKIRALASGNASEGRGVMRLRQGEAQGLAADIQARRAKQAAELQAQRAAKRPRVTSETSQPVQGGMTREQLRRSKGLDLAQGEQKGLGLGIFGEGTTPLFAGAFVPGAGEQPKPKPDEVYQPRYQPQAPKKLEPKYLGPPPEVGAPPLGGRTMKLGDDQTLSDLAFQARMTDVPRGNAYAATWAVDESQRGDLKIAQYGAAQIARERGKPTILFQKGGLAGDWVIEELDGVDLRKYGVDGNADAYMFVANPVTGAIDRYGGVANAGGRKPPAWLTVGQGQQDPKPDTPIARQPRTKKSEEPEAPESRLQALGMFRRNEVKARWEFKRGPNDPWLHSESKETALSEARAGYARLRPYQRKTKEERLAELDQELGGKSTPELQQMLKARRAQAEGLEKKAEREEAAFENVRLSQYIAQRMRAEGQRLPTGTTQTGTQGNPPKPPQGPSDPGTAGTFARPDDLGSFERIVSAFSMATHHPEKQAQRAIDAYVSKMNSDYAFVAEDAKSPRQQQVLQEEMAAYKEAYKGRYQKWLGIINRQASAFVVGPARFPVERQRRLRDQEEKVLKEMEAWSRRALKKIQTKVLDADLVKPASTQPRKNIVDNDIATVERDEEENRIRIRFKDGKPPDVVRDRLKRSGWRWSPKNSAWQRMNTTATERSAMAILEVAKDERQRI